MESNLKEQFEAILDNYDWKGSVLMPLKDQFVVFMQAAYDLCNAADLDKITEVITWAESRISELQVDKENVKPGDHVGYAIDINSRIDELTDLVTKFKKP